MALEAKQPMLSAKVTSHKKWVSKILNLAVDTLERILLHQNLLHRVVIAFLPIKHVYMDQ